MKKEYSKPFFLGVSTALSVLCLLRCSILLPSPVADCQTLCSVNGQEFDAKDHETGQYISVTIDGPDELLPCTTAQYTASTFGINLKGALSDNLSWVGEGDIIVVDQYTAKNPVTIQATKDNGTGTLKLVINPKCPDGSAITLGTKSISLSIVDLITVSYDICIKPDTKTQDGFIQLIKKSDATPVYDLTDSAWLVTEGSATLKPDSNDKTLCLVSNAIPGKDKNGNDTNYITISVQVAVNNNCKSDSPLSFIIPLGGNCFQP